MQPHGTLVVQTRGSKAADLAGWILAVLAVSVLLGWTFHVSVLISVLPDLVTMKPNTAAAFLLTGLALLRRNHRDRLCYSVGVLGIGAATLVEYALDLNIGIDQLLFRDLYSAIDPGRMSPITCVGLILLGPALALMKVKTERGRRISRGLALMAGALGTIALLGYSYDTKALYQVRPHSSVSLHTAMAFMLAAIGVQGANPAEGILRHIRADSAGGAMLRQLLPAAVLIPYLLGLAAWIAHKHLGWEVGFALALLVAAAMSCLVLVMLFNAKRLEREDLARREVNRALEDRTALLQAREELLRHTTDELQRVMASIPDYLWSAELDEQGKFEYRYYSPVVERITGRPPSFYLQDPARWLETIHPDDRSQLVRAFQRVTSGESEREEEEYRILLPNGETRWVRDCATVTRSGQRLRINGVVSDITERKKEDLELRKFMSLADHSSEFIGICDMNFKPFYANPAALNLVGLDSLEQACATPVKEFFFPEDQQFIYEEFFPRVLREGSAEVEVRFRHFKTGAALWMIYNVFYIKDSAGQPVGLATVSRDITSRKEMEDKLRESEATTRTLLETAAQAILAVDAGGTIVLANRMAEAMFGYEPNELIGIVHDVLLPERLREQHAIHRARFAASPRTRSMGMGLELRGRRKDGSEFPIEVSLSGVLTSRGPLAVSFVSDITERKQAEAALRNSEQQLRVLAGSLLTAQEEERRRLSRELHDDITQRLAFLSIELGKLARKTAVSPEETQAIIRSLQDQTLRASNEVRRISHGLHPSAIEDFGLAVALEEFCGEFEKAQGVQVRFDGLIDDLRLDDASAACLYRITQETLRNAVRHGRATEIQVSLSLTPDSVQLRVKDNGAGFVTDSSRSKATLGVVSMRERIRLVNGTLTISSRPGQGTEVIASVPLTGVGHEKNSYSRG